MKIVFDGLLGLLDTAKERISELEDINRNFQNWNAKKKKKQKNRTLTKRGTIAEVQHKMEIPEEGEKG